MLPLSRLRKTGSIPRPPDWQVAFGRRAPMEVDLGCGRGQYVLERAGRAPEIDVVAVDTRPRWIRSIRHQAALESLTNLRAIRCDARYDLPLLFAPSSVSGFTIFHPDPWWKKRHRKRRLVQAEFVELLAALLEPGGWIYVQTDVPDLADAIEALFADGSRFKAIDAQAFLRCHLAGVQSHRARKCVELGIPIRRMAHRLALPGKPESRDAF